MAFLIPALTAIGGGSAAAGALTAATAGASIYSAVKGSNASSSAANSAQQAAQNSQVDIQKLDAQTRAIAQQNAKDSAALEQQMTPEVPALRSAANQGVINGLTPSASDNASTAALTGGLGVNPGSALNTPLLQAAIAKAKANLALGGQLPQDVQNAVTRHALAQGGSVAGAGGGLGLGRDLVARDLGLTSLDLSNQRLNSAAALGGQELQLGQANNDVSFNNAAHQLNIIQLLKSISDGSFNKNLLAAQYGQSIKQPIVGLDPGAVAGVAVGNANNAGAAASNQANISGANSNNYLQLAGTLGTNALLQYNNTSSSRAGVGAPTTYAQFLANQQAKPM